MTTLATVPEFRESFELSGRDRKAAQVVADGVRDAKAENTRQSCATAWAAVSSVCRSRRPPGTPHHPAG